MKKAHPSSILLLGIIVFSCFIIPTTLYRISMNDKQNEITESQVDALTSTQFYENLGQFANQSIEYYGIIPGGFIGFAQNYVLLWSGDDNTPIKLSFINAQGNFTPSAVHEVAQKTNYFLGNRGIYIGVRAYRNILYENIWDNIDLCFTAKSDGAEYEFYVKPGADPDAISLKCEGQISTSIDSTSLHLQKDGSDLVHDQLLVKQGEEQIDARFIMRESGSLGFDIGHYDPSLTLVIDPIIYSTYIGGARTDRPRGIDVDSDGNVYVCGHTTSLNFPTANAYDDSLAGDDILDSDCFIMKINTTGNSLIYSTYIGGQYDDNAYSIVSDSDGNVYVCGESMSNDFPTVNTINDYPVASDCFVLKLSSSGDELLYSTLIGGRNLDTGFGLAIDTFGDVYVCGSTESVDFPTVNAYDNTFGDNSSLENDGFVLKLNATGNGLDYSTYIGGVDLDFASSIAVDENGTAYVLGKTYSEEFPIVNAFNGTFGGYSDCFILKLNKSGDTLLYSSFLGGRLVEDPGEIVLDSSGNMYVCGATNSEDFPVTSAYDDSYQGVYNHAYIDDGFISKLDATGQSLLYSTYIGGINWEYCSSIAVDSEGNAYVCGYTWSSDFPVVNASDSSFNGGTQDGFVLKLNVTGDSLVYSTFIGGSSWDSCWAIGVDDAGIAYVCGETESTNFPRIHAYDNTFNGGVDSFVILVTAGPQPIDFTMLIIEFVVTPAIVIAAIVVLYIVSRHRLKA